MEEHSRNDRISEWLSPENLSTAKGMTRDEVFAHFGNKYEPIASIPADYLKYLGEDITDTNVYSGKGYFIEHAINHHPDIDVSEYAKIPDILSNPDDVKLDDRNPDRTSLVFVKKYEEHGIVVVGVDATETGKIVIHKTFFKKNKSPYPQLRSVRAISSDNAHVSISHAGDTPHPPAKRFSALDDNTNLPQENADVKG